MVRVNTVTKKTHKMRYLIKMEIEVMQEMYYDSQVLKTGAACWPRVKWTQDLPNEQ